MDDTDRKLLILLAANPRMPLQGLAKRLAISRQAVHRRLEVLTKIGVLQGTSARVSIRYLDAVTVLVFGRSRTESIEETLNRLGVSSLTRRVVVAGGNFLYVVGYLREISELGDYVEFVTRTAEMPEPTAGVFNLSDELMPYSVDGTGKRMQSYKELSPLDLEIIASLKDDARRPAAEIAKLVGVTSKTVKRHIENMIADGSVDLTTPGDLALGGDLFLVMHVNLKDGADRREVGRRLLSKRYFQDQYYRTLDNIPNMLFWVFWSDKMTQIRKAVKETDEDRDVLSVVLNFVYLERVYETWRDKLPEASAHSLEITRKHKMRSRSRTQWS